MWTQARKLIRTVRHRVKGEKKLPLDYDNYDVEIINFVKPYTLTGHERIHALIQSVRYIVNNHIPGAMVECGVFRGGSIMAVARTLLQMQVVDRDLYLFDAFGLKNLSVIKTSEQDISYKGKTASELIANDPRTIPSLEEVKVNISQTGYPDAKTIFVQGFVEDTIPAQAPNQIALLRLDTDFYSSTKHELTHLFPRLAGGGVLIIDDYGHWQGARQATDEYIREHKLPLFLNRIDYTGRLAIKTFSA